MSTDRIPSVFVSHGAPTLALEESVHTEFLRALGRALGTPRAILAVSAHWDTPGFAVSGAERPRTIHDFGGFAPELYELRYPAPGAPRLADRAAALLAAEGIASDVSPTRGLDHGAWVPLRHMYPDADVPVAQLSVSSGLGPAAHVALGRALAPLRDEGVLVLGSGGAVHNLGRIDFRGGQTAPWAAAFDAWIAERLIDGNTDELARYRSLAPGATTAHPTEEHLVPVFVALGAGGEGARGEILHRGFTFGNLSMAAYAFR
jgi:4,5-DOPA dioxygenase extradiol